MRRGALLLSVLLSALVPSAHALAGNMQPTLYLEIYGLEQSFCQFTPVETTSWGAIKTLFR
jgi:hypothetical protein